uniref:Uncharacterized protein n=1 Tax=Arundo donax TaxID=35708 RepID=A0A0A9CHE9_ARUDO
MTLDHSTHQPTYRNPKSLIASYQLIR